MVRIVMFQPDIAQNVGTLLRTCACFDIGADIILPCGFPFDDKKFRRAGMDYIDMVDYKRHISFDHFYQENLQAEGAKRRLILLTTKADYSYTDFKFSNNDSIILGRESAGVPDYVSTKVDHAITIKMQPSARSLNVAIAGAIVMAEAKRQLDLIK